MTDDDPISWRAIVYGTPVVADDGTQVGTIDEVLGSDGEDIFHGVRVAIKGRHDAMVLAENISELTVAAVTTNLSAAELKSLPDYDETASYHVGSVGRFRKHLGWKEDSKSDEEPG